MCGRISFQFVFGCVSKIGKCFLSMEHEQGYGRIFSIGEDERGWMDKGR